MTPRRTRSAAIPAIVLLAGVAAAQDYFPLATGLLWTYANGSGSQLASTVLGPVEYNGLVAVELQYVESGPGAQEYHNYWTGDPGGDTWLHGAWNADGFAVTYDPPILYIDAPLALGNVWTTVFGMGGATYEITYQVYEEGDIEVPLGTFYAYGIGVAEMIVAPGDQDHDLLGRRLEGGSRQADRWYSENIGMIRDGSGFELVTFSGSVAVDAITWSGIKRLFAD